MNGMTSWERWKAGLEPEGRDERDRYREYDAAVTHVDPALTPSRGPLQVLSTKRGPKRRPS